MLISWHPQWCRLVLAILRTRSVCNHHYGPPPATIRLQRHLFSMFYMANLRYNLKQGILGIRSCVAQNSYLHISTYINSVYEPSIHQA